MLGVQRHLNRWEERACATLKYVVTAVQVTARCHLITRTMMMSGGWSQCSWTIRHVDRNALRTVVIRKWSGCIDTEPHTNARVDMVGDLESPSIILWVSLCSLYMTNQYFVGSAISEMQFGTDLPRCRERDKDLLVPTRNQYK